MESNIEKNKNKNMTLLIKGQIWFARLTGEGSVQNNIRPVIVFQNDMASKYSPVVTVIPMSSRVNKKMLTHVFIDKNVGMPVDSIALCEQIQTIDRKQMMEFANVGLNGSYLNEIKKGVMIQLGIQ